MIGEYDVLQNGKRVGRAKVVKEGLYWHIISRCVLVKNAFYRLIVVFGEKRIDLGLFVPSGNDYIVDCRVPIKQCKAVAPVFTVEQRKAVPTEMFIELVSGSPFGHIDGLDMAYFDVRDGKKGIVISLP